MLKHLTLKDFVIVETLDLEFGPGFSVLTGETGAGKSILIDALQLALGARAESLVVREGAARAEVSATFDAPAALREWLDAAGFEAGDEVLLRRTVDTQAKSRGFVNGSPATATQLREIADFLIDIHGQHAWQHLTRPAGARALLDAQAGVDPHPLAEAHAAWKQALSRLEHARRQQGELDEARERLAWRISEIERLAPRDDEWPQLNAEHQRLAHAQALLDAAAQAQEWISEADTSAARLAAKALAALDGVVAYDERLRSIGESLREARTHLDDAAHELNTYLSRADLDPARLADLDARLSAWLGLARRLRQPPQDLPALLAQWRNDRQRLEAAADLAALQKQVETSLAAWRAQAERISRLRQAAAAALADRVTAAMPSLGMAGGSFNVELIPQETPQPFGLESAGLLIAGHAGSVARPLAKVASGGELSRLALAIAVTTAQHSSGSAATTLIFDEIDAGIGGTVADTVGRLMRQLGRSAQVLAVTHLPQVAACADRHFVVTKAARNGQTISQIDEVRGEDRVAEIARMLGGAAASATSLAHARQLIDNHGQSQGDRQ